MKTFVTTCPQNAHMVGDFVTLAAKFYGRELVIDTALPDEHKSEQLRRMLEPVKDEYIILMEEDFYLTSHVDLQLLNDVCDFCEEQNVDRFSLQSKNVYRISNWRRTAYRVGEPHIYGHPSLSHTVYSPIPAVKSQFGLDASVWKRSFLLDNVGYNRNDWAIETYGWTAAQGAKICALDVAVMKYVDAMRAGKRTMELRHDPLRLVTTHPKYNKYLYPQTNSSNTLLL